MRTDPALVDSRLTDVASAPSVRLADRRSDTGELKDSAVSAETDLRTCSIYGAVDYDEEFPAPVRVELFATERLARQDSARARLPLGEGDLDVGTLVMERE